MARTRSRSVAAGRGVCNSYRVDKQTGAVTWYYGPDMPGSAQTARTETMTDVDTGDFVTPNTVTHDYVTKEGGFMNGYRQVVTDLQTHTYSAVDLSLSGRGLSPVASIPATKLPPLGEIATDALSRSSPDRPTVSIPVSIGELKDFPRQLQNLLGSRTYQEKFYFQRKNYRLQRPKRLTRKKPYQSANSIAEWEFGWLPLIRDIVSLFSIPYVVDSRVDRILANAGVLKEHRTIASYNDSVLVNSNYSFSTLSGFACSTRITQEREEEARCVVTWTPRKGNYTPSDPDLRKRVRQQALGLSPHMLVFNAWQLLPWSWLADWFGNTGDFLLANSSLIDYRANTVISVKRSISSVHTPISTSPGMSVSPFKVSRGRWTRWIDTPPLWAPIRTSPSVMTPKQLSILLGIAGNMRSGYMG